MTYDVSVKSTTVGKHFIIASPPGDAPKMIHFKTFDDGLDAWIFAFEIRAHIRENPQWEPAGEYWSEESHSGEEMPGFD